MATKSLGLFLICSLFLACANEKNGFENGGNGQKPPQESYIIRTNQKTGQAEYAIARFAKDTPSEELAKLAESITDWRPMDPNQVITSSSGFPSEQSNLRSSSTYFIRDPENFRTQKALPQVQSIPGQAMYNPPGPVGGPGYGNPPGPVGGPGYGNPPGPVGGPGYGYGGYNPPGPAGGPGYGYGGYNPPGPAGGPGYGYGGYNPPGPAGGPGYGYTGYPYCTAASYYYCYGYLPATYYNSSWYYWNPCSYYVTPYYTYSFYAYSW